MLRLLAGLLIVAGIGVAAYYLQLHAGERAAKNAARPAPPVIVEPVGRRELVDQIEAVGSTYAMESVTLTAPVTDPIVEIRFEDGQKVKRNDILIVLDTSVLRAELAAAQATFEEAEKQLERIKTLASRGAGTETRLDEQERIRSTAKAEVERIAAEIERRQIRAPFDGVMGLRRVSVGALVQPGTELASLQSVTQLKLDFTLPELYLAALKPGQEVIAKSPVYADRTFSGKVSAIESVVDPVSRAVTIRAIIDNSDGALAPGMLMTVGVIRERVMAIMIPEEALVSISDKRYVYKLEAGDKVKRVEIRTGRRKPGFIEVVEGLAEKEVIVVDGVIRIKDGAAVKPQNRQPAGPNA